MPTATRDDVMAVFVAELSPTIGPTMAGATSRVLCERFLRDTAPLNPRGIAAVLDALEPGLHVFVGKEKTPAVIASIRAALQALGGRA